MEAALATSGSDALVGVAYLIGVVSLVLTLLLTLQVAWLQLAARRLERRQRRCLETWRPILYDAAMGEAPAVPPLAPDDEATFLLLWNQLQDGLRGRSSREGLNRLAATVGAHAAALRALARKAAASRMLALRTLRYLGEPADFDRVEPLLDAPEAPICLAAARALFHIDRAAATPELWTRLRTRVDWPMAQVAALLRDSDLGEAELAGLATAINGQVHRLTTAELRRILPLLAIFDEADVSPMVHRLLAPFQVPEVLSAALKEARGPALLPDVVRLCTHPAWPVRTQAATALGRLGRPEHRDLLLGMMADPQWWVRYRAAQALLSGRFGEAGELAALGDRLSDRFARDILCHVLAEGRA